MSERQLRLRMTSSRTQQHSLESTKMPPTQTRSACNKSDPSAKDMSGDSENDDSDSAKSAKSKSGSSKFTKNDKSDMVKLLYEEEMVEFSKNRAEMDSDDNDMAYDSKPLINFKKSDDFFEEAYLTDAREGVISLSFQVFVPFLIAGFGTVGAGLVLDVVQHWEVFRQVSEVFILVPALLGLKGNLEMTLASRLSTQANLGNMNTVKDQWVMATGNIALIQCQAAVVGFLAAVFAILMDWLPEGQFSLQHALLLCASSLLTASVASFILGIVMIGVVIVSHRCRINPDNVATPIAASLGDLTTLALLSYISNSLFYTTETSPSICSLLIALFLLLIPFWCYIAKNNTYTREVLFTGWAPVISAMAISSIGGCILDFAVSRFKGIAVFQPVINGVGGNLVAVQASRISTYLHQRSILGTLPKSDARVCFSPCSAYFGKNVHARTARILLLMVIPGHLVFTYGIRFLQAGHTSVTPLFLFVYLSAAFIQVMLLLYFAHAMILWMWTRHIDPDNSAIPYLTALGDLLGTALLAIAFFILFSIGDRDADVGD